MNNLPGWFIDLMADPLQAAAIVALVAFIVFLACFWKEES